MFIMQGEEVKLVRHIISYVDHETEMQEMCVSDEHKSDVEKLLSSRGSEFVSEAVDQTGNEWFNGLEFDSYDEALAVFGKGEQAYLQEKQRQELTDNLRLRTDIDNVLQSQIADQTANELALAELAEIVLGG